MKKKVFIKIQKKNYFIKYFPFCDITQISFIITLSISLKKIFKKESKINVSEEIAIINVI